MHTTTAPKTLSTKTTLKTLPARLITVAGRALASRLMTTVVPAVLCCCTGKTLHHEYRHIPRDGWGRTDTLTFHIDSLPRSGIMHVATSLRTTASFRLNGVWVARKLLLSHPEQTVCDTVFIETTSEGIFSKGEGIILTTFTHVGEISKIQQGQDATLQLYHVTAKEYLTDIQDVGVRISVADASSQHRSGGTQTEGW